MYYFLPAARIERDLASLGPGFFSAGSRLSLIPGVVKSRLFLSAPPSLAVVSHENVKFLYNQTMMLKLSRQVWKILFDDILDQGVTLAFALPIYKGDHR